MVPAATSLAISRAYLSWRYLALDISFRALGPGAAVQFADLLQLEMDAGISSEVLWAPAHQKAPTSLKET